MTLGLIGCGKMGGALLQGVIRAGLVQAGEVYVCDAYTAAAEGLAKAHPGLVICESAVEVAGKVDVLILAVKPKDIAPLLPALAELSERVLFISIAAGVTLAQLQAGLGEKARIIRVMPNTPAQVGRGYSAFARSASAVEADAALAADLFGAVGIADEVPEHLLDAITGLSGSGPAYVFAIIEALADGGVLMGLPRAAALRAAAQTLTGAAEMVLATGKHPGALKDEVTSPGGTTIAGLEQLEAHGLRNALIQAVRKATERSQQLGEPPAKG